MSEQVQGVVVSHGDLAAGLVGAVADITGNDAALRAISNKECSATTLQQKIAEAVGSRPSVIFVDLPNGSCLQAAALQMRKLPNISVVCGVNLAMLVDFVYHREATPREAAARAVEKGLSSVQPLNP